MTHETGCCLYPQLSLSKDGGPEELDSRHSTILQSCRRTLGRPGTMKGNEWVRLHPSITTLSTPSSHEKYLLEHP